MATFQRKPYKRSAAAQAMKDAAERFAARFEAQLAAANMPQIEADARARIEAEKVMLAARKIGAGERA